MKLTKEQRKGQKILHQIYLRAWTNENFKNALKENPKKTLEEYFGNKIPNKKQIVFTDQSNPDCIYINLPVCPDMEDLELMSKELDDITGGNFVFSINELIKNLK